MRQFWHTRSESVCDHINEVLGWEDYGQDDAGGQDGKSASLGVGGSLGRIQHHQVAKSRTSGKVFAVVGGRVQVVDFRPNITVTNMKSSTRHVLMFHWVSHKNSPDQAFSPSTGFLYRRRDTMNKLSKLPGTPASIQFFSVIAHFPQSNLRRFNSLGIGAATGVKCSKSF